MAIVLVQSLPGQPTDLRVAKFIARCKDGLEFLGEVSRNIRQYCWWSGIKCYAVALQLLVLNNWVKRVVILFVATEFRQTRSPSPVFKQQNVECGWGFYDYINAAEGEFWIRTMEVMSAWYSPVETYRLLKWDCWSKSGAGNTSHWTYGKILWIRKWEFG